MSMTKTSQEIQIMREGGQKLAQVMQELLPRIQPGIATDELDRAAEALILNSGAEIGFKGYDGFPKNICVSVNDEIVHGVPSARVLKEGDIVTLDIGLKWKGYYADMARTVPVGEVDPEVLRLIRVAKKALRLGIKKARAGNTIGDIGNTIQRFVEDQGFQVVRELCGHGIGTDLHEEPFVPNYGKRHTGLELKEGMVICIEPMVATGSSDIAAWKSEAGKGFVTFKTKDGALSAHFEDTIAITQDGSEVLTK